MIHPKQKESLYMNACYLFFQAWLFSAGGTPTPRASLKNLTLEFRVELSHWGFHMLILKFADQIQVLAKLKQAY